MINAELKAGRLLPFYAFCILHSEFCTRFHVSELGTNRSQAVCVPRGGARRTGSGGNREAPRAAPRAPQAAVGGREDARPAAGAAARARAAGHLRGLPGATRALGTVVRLRQLRERLVDED